MTLQAEREIVVGEFHLVNRRAFLENVADDVQLVRKLTCDGKVERLARDVGSAMGVQQLDDREG